MPVKLTPLTVLILLMLPDVALALDVPATKTAVDKVLDQEYPHLDALYKDIHRHPELG